MHRSSFVAQNFPHSAAYLKAQESSTFFERQKFHEEHTHTWAHTWMHARLPPRAAHPSACVRAQNNTDRIIKIPLHSYWDENLQVENNDICWESRNPLCSTHRNTHKTAHVHSEADKYTNSPAWRYAYWIQTVQPVISDQAHSMCVWLQCNCCGGGNRLGVSSVTCAAWCAATAEAILAQKWSAACVELVLEVMCCGYQRN